MHVMYLIIGNRIRDIREGLGLSQTELAKRAGIGRTTLTHIESARHQVRLHTLYKIAECLGVSIHTILPEVNQYSEKTIRELFTEYLNEKLIIKEIKND